MSSFFHRVLLATEGTEFDVGSERVAVEMVAQWSLPLLAVVVGVSNPEFEIVAPQLAERAEAEAATHLDKLRQLAQARGVELHGSVRMGEALEQEIVAEAGEREAGLIVLRRRGRRGFIANRLIGAMVHTVIGHARCNVLIVPRAAKMWSRRILLATDGSANSERATEVAAEVAIRSALPISVVCVSSHPREDKAIATAYVERALALLRAAGASANGQTRDGRPHEAILAVGSEVEADLIVLGRRGTGGVERLLLGSTSERVAGLADCPVMIVPG